MNKQCAVCVVSDYYVRPGAACFEIFLVSFGFPEFYSTAFLDMLVKVYLVAIKLGFIQHFSKSKAHSTKTNTVN